jgi:hypothetical protein
MTDIDIEEPTGTPLDVSKVVRLGAMLRTLRAEVRDTATDVASRARLASIHNEIQAQLAQAVSEELGDELAEFSSCCYDNPSPTEAEIRVAHAQLLGWIEGLLQGVQLSIGISETDPSSEPEGDSQAAGYV